MGFSHKLLGKDEDILVHLRRQATSLIPHAVAFVVMAVAAAVLIFVLPSRWRPASLWIIFLVFIVASIPVILLPWWRWRTTTYTITNKRIVVRHGIWTKQGHDISLATVESVEFQPDETNLTTGELILHTRDGHSLTLQDVPSIHRVYSLIDDIVQSARL